MKHTVLPDGHPPTAAFTVLAQLCGPQAGETEMGVTLFAKNCEGRNFDFDTNVVSSNLVHFAIKTIVEEGNGKPALEVCSIEKTQSPVSGFC